MSEGLPSPGLRLWRPATTVIIGGAELCQLIYFKACSQPGWEVNTTNEGPTLKLLQLTFSRIAGGEGHLSCLVRRLSRRRAAARPVLAWPQIRGSLQVA